MIDAHEIVPGLWQGSQPRPGTAVFEEDFDVLVLCAREYQPPAHYFPGLMVLHAPNDDYPLQPLSREDLQMAIATASQLADYLLAGRSILVTCLAGINRSGLVVALTLHRAFGYSGRACIELVRRKRIVDPGYPPLSNQRFVEALLKLSGTDLDQHPV